MSESNWGVLHDDGLSITTRRNHCRRRKNSCWPYARLKVNCRADGRGETSWCAVGIECLDEVKSGRVQLPSLDGDGLLNNVFYFPGF